MSTNISAKKDTMKNEIVIAILLLLLLMALKKLFQYFQHIKIKPSPNTPISSPPCTPPTSPVSPSPPHYPPLHRRNAMPRNTPFSLPFPSNGNSNSIPSNSRSWSYADLRPRRLFSDPTPESVNLKREVDSTNN